MYITRFRGGSTGTGSSNEGPQIPEASSLSLIRSLESGRPDNFRRRIDGNRKGIISCHHIHIHTIVTLQASVVVIFSLQDTVVITSRVFLSSYILLRISVCTVKKRVFLDPSIVDSDSEHVGQSWPCRLTLCWLRDPCDIHRDHPTPPTNTAHDTCVCKRHTERVTLGQSTDAPLVVGLGHFGWRCSSEAMIHVVQVVYINPRCERKCAPAFHPPSPVQFPPFPPSPLLFPPFPQFPWPRCKWAASFVFVWWINRELGGMHNLKGVSVC